MTLFVKSWRHFLQYPVPHTPNKVSLAGHPRNTMAMLRFPEILARQDEEQA